MDKLPQHWVSVDPGANGGIAWWEGDQVVEVAKIKKTKGSPYFSPEDLDNLTLADGLWTDFMVIEKPFTHKPKIQSMNSHCTTWACWGQLLGFFNLPNLELVEAKAWKGRMDLSSSKEESLTMARSMWPEFSEQLKFKNCDGVAEALLIGQDYVNRTK